MTDNLPSRLIMFDGVCNLCNASVQFIIARDHEALFRFASLQSDAGQEVLRRFALPVADFDSFVYLRDGKVYQRSTAALYMLKDIGGFWKITYVFMLIPRPLRDFVYDTIAKYRYKWFGKRDVCMVPTKDLKKRFL